MPVTPSRTAEQRLTPQLRCSVKRSEHATWLQVTGELDIATAPLLRRRLNEALSDAMLVVLDLRQLGFIDAAGLHVISDTSESALAQGRCLLVTRGPANVSRVIEICGVSDKLVILDIARGERDSPTNEGAAEFHMTCSQTDPHDGRISRPSASLPLSRTVTLKPRARVSAVKHSRHH